MMNRLDELMEIISVSVDCGRPIPVEIVEEYNKLVGGTKNEDK